MIDPVLDQSEAVALLASWPRLKMCLRQKHRKKEKKSVLSTTTVVKKAVLHCLHICLCNTMATLFNMLLSESG